MLIHGKEYNLSPGADLRGANFGGVKLQGIDLAGADLREADCMGADFTGAAFMGADLREVDFSGATLRGADLRWTDLRETNLFKANLMDTDLEGTKLLQSQADLLTIVSEGALIGWKQCRDNVIVKLRIPEAAKRSNGTDRKCRAEYVEVLEVFGGTEGISTHDSNIVYRVGKTVRCDKWNEDRWNTCGGGIHFFITRSEAEEY